MVQQTPVAKGNRVRELRNALARLTYADLYLGRFRHWIRLLQFEIGRLHGSTSSLCWLLTRVQACSLYTRDIHFSGTLLFPLHPQIN
jgi:hypothetical protein